MKLGLHYWTYSAPGDVRSIAPTLERSAFLADQAGFASFTVMDHYFQMEHRGEATEPMLEGYTALGYVAGHTSRVTLGLMVTGVMYRYPGLLAKIVTTLDVLSEGRARLGIGASWYEREQRALGVPVVPVAERFERLEETLRIARQMWSEDDGSFEGAHYRLGATMNTPQPLRRPYPPILIGGGGERKTLRLVAQYADACNLFGGPELERKLDVLRTRCEEVGRDYDEIEKTVMARLDPADPKAAVEELRGYAALGVQHVHTVVPDVAAIEPLRVFGSEIIPAADGL